jgi:hypothetical protein
VNIDKLWDVLINKAHVAIGSVCQGAILAWHWKTGKTLDANVAQTVNWFYMFLAGHFVGSQAWPDKSAPAADQDKG